MRRPAVNHDVEPDDAVVAAPDQAPFPALHHHDVVGPQRHVIHHPAGAEQAVGLLVRRERDLDIAARRHRGGAQGAQRQHEARDRALHVGGAAAVDPAVLDRRLEGAPVTPAAAGGHHIVMGVEMEGLGARPSRDIR